MKTILSRNDGLSVYIIIFFYITNKLIYFPSIIIVKVDIIISKSITFIILFVF